MTSNFSCPIRLNTRLRLENCPNILNDKAEELMQKGRSKTRPQRKREKTQKKPKPTKYPTFVRLHAESHELRHLRVVANHLRRLHWGKRPMRRSVREGGETVIQWWKEREREREGRERGARERERGIREGEEEIERTWGNGCVACDSLHDVWLYIERYGDVLCE